MSCYSCDRKPLKQRYVWKGKSHTYVVWYLNKGTPYKICKMCYDEIFANKSKKKLWDREYRERHPDRIKRFRTEWNEKRKRSRHTRTLTYKGRTLEFSYDIKCGVCNWCRRVSEIDIKRTALHHYQDIYCDNEPLKNTIELCHSCHSKLLKGHKHH